MTTEMDARPDPFPQTCPMCGGQLFVARPDPLVPTYPTYSEVIPVPERHCAACGLTWVGQGGALVRTITALAQARHELRQLRRAMRNQG